MLPHTTKRTTTNLKSINNQKHQKIKLHGTPTTKELNKKIYQNNQTSKVAGPASPLRKTAATGAWTLGAELTAQLGRGAAWEGLT